MTEILTGIVIAVVSSIVTSLITFQLSIRKFRSEKWWELKIASYQKIIEALHESKLFSSLHLQAYEEDAEVTDKKAEELRIKGRAANDEILKAIDVGAFLLSAQAIERLRQYVSDSSKAEDTNEWYEHLDMDYIATKSCLDDLIVVAKNDLAKAYDGFDFKSFVNAHYHSISSKIKTKVLS